MITASNIYNLQKHFQQTDLVTTIDNLFPKICFLHQKVFILFHRKLLIESNYCKNQLYSLIDFQHELEKN